MKNSSHTRIRAFGFIQLIAAVAVVGIIAVISISKMTNLSDRAEESRLNEHVHSLNSSVKMYLSSGGSLDGLTTAQAVIDKMKKHAAEGEKIPGYRGGFIDYRLTAVEQSDAEAAVDGELRVLWDDVEQQFKIAVDGSKGIKEFKIDPSASPETVAPEERSAFFELAANDSEGAWVWDFDRNTTVETGTIVTVGNSNPNADIDPTGSNNSKEQLLQPELDPPSGQYALNEYGEAGKSITISNPNNSNGEVSEVYASVNGSYWQTVESGGSVAVPPGGNVATFAHVKENFSTSYYNSYVRSAVYEGTSTTLTAPSIQSSATTFHPIDEPVITVDITHSNDPAHGKIVYSVNGSDWNDYVGTVTLNITEYLSGASIIAKSIATKWPENYLESAEVSATLGIQTLELDKPMVAASASSLHPISSPNVTVTITYPNADHNSISKLQFALNGSETWADYNEPVVLSIDDYSDGVTIRAKAAPTTMVGAITESAVESITLDAIDIMHEPPVIAATGLELHPLTNASVEISITNVEQSVYQAVYSVNSGETWTPYEEPFTVDIDEYSTGVTVQAKATPTAHEANVIETEEESVEIAATTITLDIPEIALSANAFDALNNQEITASINDPNDSEVSQVVYSLDNGQNWDAYLDAQLLHLDDYLTGATVLAKATPKIHPNNIIASDQVQAVAVVNEATLQSPEIVADPPTLVIGQTLESTISLVNYNGEAYSTMQYAINGGDWLPYETAFQASLSDYPAGLTITAQSVATQYTSLLHNSQVAARDIEVQLQGPTFSITTSSCCENEYDKSLFLSESNGISGVSIYYSVNGGAEQLYDPNDANLGAINIPGNTIVTAYCKAPEGSLVLDSESVSHEYNSQPQLALVPPTISPGGSTFTESILVTIEAPSEDPDALLVYTVDGSNPEVDEDGNVLNGEVYEEAFTLDYYESGDRSLILDWEDSLWNEGAGWLDYGGDQTLLNIGGLGLDVTVSQLDETALGAFLDNYGDEVVLSGDGGETPDLGYSILFSESVNLDTFTTGGLTIMDDIEMANRIDLFGEDGTQLLLGSIYVTSSQFANVYIKDGGIETVATSETEGSETTYDFGGLSIQELQWLHYGYQGDELDPPDPPTPDPDDECQWVQSYTLIDTITNEPVPGYDPIPSGIKLNLAHLPENISIRANINGESCGDGNNGHGNNIDGFDSSNEGDSSGVAGVEDSDPTVDDEIKSHPSYGGDGIVGTIPGSVKIVINGASRTENSAPYSLKGDSDGEYYAWNPSPGSYSVTATPFKNPNANGNAGTPMSMTFEVIDDENLPDPLDPASRVGHQMTSFLSDINFHVAGDMLLPANFAVKAIAVPSGNVSCRTFSQVAEENYVIEPQPVDPSQLPTPEVSPNGGRYLAQTVVTISIDESAPDGTRIYYTLDGTVPVGDEFGNPTTGVEYTGAFTLSHGGAAGSEDVTKYVRARAFAPEGQTLSYLPSNGSSAKFDFGSKQRINAPQISPSGNVFSGSADITMTLPSNAPEGSMIYYSTQGIDPGAGDAPTSGTQYTGPFTVYHDGSSIDQLDKIIVARVYPPAEVVDYYETSYQASELYTFNPDFVLTFDELFAGYVHGSQLDNEYDTFGGGVTISAGRDFQDLWDHFVLGEEDRAITFDTSLTGTADDDLEALNLDVGNLGSLGQDAFGNSLIVAENLVDADGDGIIDSPDDNGSGGWAHFDFDSTSVTNFGFDVLDIDSGESSDFFAFIYDDAGSYYRLTGDEMRDTFGSTEGTVVWGDYSANRIDPISAAQMSLTNISGVLFNLPNGGSFDNISFSLGSIGL